MLIQFRIKNFRSFRDEQILSLQASRDNALGTNAFQQGRFNLLKSVAVYGANASGKSNLIRAVRFMRDLVVKSADRPADREILVDPFRREEASPEQPSLFEVVFSHQGVRFRYGFTAQRRCIGQEWLIAYPNNRPQQWFRRGLDPATGQTTWRIGPNLKGAKSRLAKRTHSRALFLSVGAKFHNRQLSSVHQWFNRNLLILDLSQVRPGAPAGIGRYTAIRSARDETFRCKVANLLRSADLGIEQFDVKVKPIAADAGGQDLAKQLFAKGFLAKLGGFSVPHVRTFHRIDGTDRYLPFDLKDESYGAQRFFALAGPWLDVLAGGHTLFVDELQMSMNALLTRRLLELFQDPRYNQNNAQLVFTTHDVTTLDRKLFRRDQIWFTQKRHGGTSQLYSLYSQGVRPRKTAAWQKGYLAGRYGAVPRLEGLMTSAYRRAEAAGQMESDGARIAVAGGPGLPTPEPVG